MSYNKSSAVASLVTIPEQRKEVSVPWMIRRNLPEVLQIEQDSFRFPWYRDDFIRCLRERNCIGRVVEFGEKIVGFMLYEFDKMSYHIIRLAVHPAFRRQDIGTHMVGKLVSECVRRHRLFIRVDVRETNLSSQLFFRDLGFRATCVLPTHYGDTDEDAYLMKYCIESSEEETP